MFEIATKYSRRIREEERERRKTGREMRPRREGGM
jgi:hypothetical protein